MSNVVDAFGPRPAASGFPSGRHAPSILLPLRFVLTGALAFLAALLLMFLRPELLATYHYNQYVVAITHLIVLGWISTIVMGAMYQLVPVALETRLYSERLARWQFLLHLVGFAGMVWMFWTWNMKQVGHFGCVLGLGVGLFVYNLFRTLVRVPRWNVVATAVASALVWLSLAILAGLTLAAGKCSYDSAAAATGTGALGALLHGLRSAAGFVTRFDQIGAMHAHAHLGALGVFVMLIVGISYKLVPMFTLSELQSRWRAGVSLVLLNLGLAASFVAILLRSRFRPACAFLVIAGLALYGFEMGAILRARKRRALDWGVKYFLTAIVLLVPQSLLACVLSWPSLPLNVFTGQFENLYGFLGLLGVVSFAIIGMLYKIVPFLVWYRSYSGRIGLNKVPSLADLYCPHLQAVGYRAYLLGLGVTSVATVLGSAAAVRWGCGILGFALLTLELNLVKMLRHLVQPRLEPFQTKSGAAVQAPNCALRPVGLEGSPVVLKSSVTGSCSQPGTSVSVQV
jgi:hypothetical protein